MIAEKLETGRNHEGFAFFYCNQTEPTRRQALSVLRSVVRQLSSPRSISDHLHCELKQLYFQSRREGAGWTLDLCKKHLVELFNLYPHTTIILDALDECEIEERRLLLNTFDEVLNSSPRPVKIFISSRPEGDIRERLIQLPNLEISARNNNDDIAKFIRESTNSPAPWSRALQRNMALKDEIVETLIGKSDGMFQWARLQVDQLRLLEHEKDLRARLGKLPKDLKSSYDEIYQRIEDRPEYSRDRTFRALKWVMYSPEPLSTEELLDAIRVDPEMETIDEPDEVDEDQLIGWCANLLIQYQWTYTYGKSSNAWRPCHLSVVEYLENRFKEHTAHLFATKVSFFLLIAPWDEDDSVLSHMRRWAVQNWMMLVYSYEKPDIDFKLAPHDKLVTLLKRFLGSPAQSSDAYVRWVNSRTGSIETPAGLSFYTVDLEPTSSPLFIACITPLFHLLRDWWESDDLEFDHLALNQSGECLLTLAARSGCIPIYDSLIRRGTPVNPKDHHSIYGSPLATAVAEGHAYMIDFLLDRGAEVDLLLQGGLFRSALACSTR